MTRLSPRHPRYASLTVRAHLAEAMRQGTVVPEGLIAHGRGEAFDYFLGERTTPSARRAERLAADWLAAARHPVVSVNGNVAALAAPAIARLQRARPGLLVEVNLFHRTAGRARRIGTLLRRAGVRGPLGLHPSARIPGLPSDRARVDARGIARADVCLVPLEDGDRTEALRAIGKRVITIDLNPLSRTSRASDLPIVDELGRALAGITEALEAKRGGRRRTTTPRWRPEALLADARRQMARGLTRPGAGSPPGSRRRASTRAARRSARP
jgi:4-phosphopantoate---beta-alanine ligase